MCHTLRASSRHRGSGGARCSLCCLISSEWSWHAPEAVRHERTSNLGPRLDPSSREDLGRHWAHLLAAASNRGPCDMKRRSECTDCAPRSPPSYFSSFEQSDVVINTRPGLSHVSIERRSPDLPPPTHPPPRCNLPPACSLSLASRSVSASTLGLM